MPPGNTYDFLDEIYLALHNDSTLILKMGNEKNFCDSRSNLANSIWQRGVVATVFSHSESYHLKICMKETPPNSNNM